MQVLHQGTIRFAEARFYFRIGSDVRKTLAIASLFSMPDEAIYQHTHGVLTVCEYRGEQIDEKKEDAQSLVVIEIESIKAVVGMVPFGERAEGQNPRFFLAEKLGLDVYDLGTTLGEDSDDEE